MTDRNAFIDARNGFSRRAQWIVHGMLSRAPGGHRARLQTGPGQGIDASP